MEEKTGWKSGSIYRISSRIRRTFFFDFWSLKSRVRLICGYKSQKSVKNAIFCNNFKNSLEEAPKVMFNWKQYIVLKQLYFHVGRHILSLAAVCDLRFCTEFSVSMVIFFLVSNNGILPRDARLHNLLWSRGLSTHAQYARCLLEKYVFLRWKKGVSLAVTTVHSGTNLTNLIALHISANIT